MTPWKLVLFTSIIQCDVHSTLTPNQSIFRSINRALRVHNWSNDIPCGVRECIEDCPCEQTADLYYIITTYRVTGVIMNNRTCGVSFSSWLMKGNITPAIFLPWPELTQTLIEFGIRRELFAKEDKRVFQNILIKRGTMILSFWNRLWYICFSHFAEP